MIGPLFPGSGTSQTFAMERTTTPKQQLLLLVSAALCTDTISLIDGEHLRPVIAVQVSEELAQRRPIAASRPARSEYRAYHQQGPERVS